MDSQKSEKECSKICCICGDTYVGLGNNPEPIKSEGRCCGKCNYEKVIPARIALLTRRSDR